MVDVYNKQIRSILELAVPVWQAGLTKQESNQIERVQRTAFHIILGENYLYYENALNQLKCDRLSGRRLKLCENFAKKAVRHEQFRNWFRENTERLPIMNTRYSKVKSKYHEVLTRTERFKKSPIPYLTSLLNNLADK